MLHRQNTAASVGVCETRPRPDVDVPDSRGRCRCRCRCHLHLFEAEIAGKSTETKSRLLPFDRIMHLSDQASHQYLECCRLSDSSQNLDLRQGRARYWKCPRSLDETEICNMQQLLSANAHLVEAQSHSSRPGRCLRSGYQRLARFLSSNVLRMLGHEGLAKYHPTKKHSPNNGSYGGCLNRFPPRKIQLFLTFNTFLQKFVRQQDHGLNTFIPISIYPIQL